MTAEEVNRLFSTTRPDVPFYVGAARSQVGTCAMNVAFGLARPLDVATALPSPDAFVEPQPGKTPPAALYHYLWPVAAGTDCRPCEDVFAAKVIAEK